MILGIAEDFSRNVELDAELLARPSSGIYVNSGTHPSITLDNLLHFLPNEFDGIKVWDSSVTYGKFEDTRRVSNIVTKGSKIYQSLALSTNEDPEGETDNWLETNLESLVLKTFLYKTYDRAKSDLNLVRRLVNNQYLYEVGEHEVQLPNDYAGWVFEPKGSDYLSFRINQIAFQKKSTDQVNLYVINQGVLVDTLTLTPENGKLNFVDLGYEFSGKGKWIFAIDSTSVLVDDGVIDPLSYDGFLAYTTIGAGETPEGSKWSYGTTGNGLGFNISVSLDSSVYLDNNLLNHGSFVRACFEYLAFQMFLHNPNNVSSREQRIQMDKEILIAEIKSMEADTVARRYHSEKKRAVRQLEKVFDTQLNDNGEMYIELASI